MGKRGNQRRKFLRAQDTGTSPLDENIQNALAEEEYKASLTRIYGKPGPPTAESVIVLPPPGQPQPQPQPVLDLLGRKIDASSIPPALRATTMQKAPTAAAITGKRRVSLMRDHDLEYPELWMEVFISPDPSVRDDEARFAQMFARARCSRAKSVLESDLVVFGGGSDVDPALYGEEKHCTTYFDTKRDSDDIALYKLCVENGIPMLGVCRGAQFLHVMNGGKLYQDIDHHYGDHQIWDVNRKMFVEKVSSVHHQMCIENTKGGMEILATNSDARNRSLNPGDRVLGPRADVEAFYYRDTCCIGVQGHPEYAGYGFFTKWVLEQINELILCSPDIEWRTGSRRVKLDLLEERKHIGPSTISAPSDKQEKK